MGLFLEQLLNGVQFGIMLFLVSAGLTLVFGIMNLINLAHGSLYMIGAFIAATVTANTGSFLVGALAALVGAAVVGMAMETTVFRRLYDKEHLNQVLATFGLILIFNELAVIIWGRTPVFTTVPPFLGGAIELVPGLFYPNYRLAITVVGLLVSAALYLGIQRTRIGMLIRAGSTNREMVRALGVDIRLLYTLVFGIGTLLAGLAGVMIGPILSVQVGMGEQILILAFVVIVVGGIGSIRGAMFGALLIGLVDTLTRSFAPDLLRAVLSASEADNIAGVLSSIMAYLVMALVLLWRPQGLFASHA
jgi:branched-chain amino acid transport system permease protein